MLSLAHCADHALYPKESRQPKINKQCQNKSLTQINCLHSISETKYIQIKQFNSMNCLIYYLMRILMVILHENFIMETRFKLFVRQDNTITNNSFIHNRDILT
jgi:hypothetical protein